MCVERRNNVKHPRHILVSADCNETLLFLFRAYVLTVSYILTLFVHRRLTYPGNTNNTTCLFIMSTRLGRVSKDDEFQFFMFVVVSLLLRSDEAGSFPNFFLPFFYVTHVFFLPSSSFFSDGVFCFVSIFRYHPSPSFSHKIIELCRCC